LRLSETLNLRREDIGHSHATIVNSNSGQSRRVPLTPELRADLLARCHKGGYVFGLADDGRPLKAAAVSVAFCRLARALKLTGISHHTLRHTGATVMVANGVSLRAVQTIGGWTSSAWLNATPTLTTPNWRALSASRINTLRAQRAGPQKGPQRVQRPVGRLAAAVPPTRSIIGSS